MPYAQSRMQNLIRGPKLDSESEASDFKRDWAKSLAKARATSRAQTKPSLATGRPVDPKSAAHLVWLLNRFQSWFNVDKELPEGDQRRLGDLLPAPLEVVFPGARGELRGSLGRVWDMARQWQEETTFEHRNVKPQILLAAAVNISLLWGPRGYARRAAGSSAGTISASPSKRLRGKQSTGLGEPASKAQSGNATAADRCRGGGSHHRERWAQ